MAEAAAGRAAGSPAAGGDGSREAAGAAAGAATGGPGHAGAAGATSAPGLPVGSAGAHAGAAGSAGADAAAAGQPAMATGAGSAADAEAARRIAAATRTASTGRFLKPDQLDDLGRAVLFLARELWVTRDRLAVIEAVLDARGLDVSAAVADFQPDPALASRLAAERKALVEGLVATLCPPPEEGATTS